MTGDPATPPPTSGAASAKPGFYPIYSELQWTVHSTDSWAQAIATALLNRADGTPPFKTGAPLEMTRHGDRVRVSLHFTSLGPEGSAVYFNEAFLLTI